MKYDVTSLVILFAHVHEKVIEPIGYTKASVVIDVKTNLIWSFMCFGIAVLTAKLYRNQYNDKKKKEKYFNHFITILWLSSVKTKENDIVWDSDTKFS